jgi:hypothetical protein
MDDHQYGVPAASPDCTGGSNSHYRTLVSAIERSGITGSGVIAADDGRFDQLFTASAPRQIALAPATWFSSWAPRCAEADVDTEILNWIVSHVPSRKRSQAH